MPKGREDRIDTVEMISVATGHPLRRRIMREYFENDGLTISPVELADRLESPLSSVAYHVRVLAKKVSPPALKLVRTEPVRGSVQHFYAASRELSENRLLADLLRQGDGRSNGPKS